MEQKNIQTEIFRVRLELDKLKQSIKEERKVIQKDIMKIIKQWWNEATDLEELKEELNKYFERKK